MSEKVLSMEEERALEAASRILEADPWGSGLLEEGEPLFCDAGDGLCGTCEPAGEDALVLCPGPEAVYMRLRLRDALENGCGRARTGFIRRMTDKVILAPGRGGITGVPAGSPESGAVSDEAMEGVAAMLEAGAEALERAGSEGLAAAPERAASLAGPPEAPEGVPKFYAEMVDASRPGMEGLDFMVVVSEDGSFRNIAAPMVPGEDGASAVSFMHPRVFGGADEAAVETRDLGCAGFLLSAGALDGTAVWPGQAGERRIPVLDDFADDAMEALTEAALLSRSAFEAAAEGMPEGPLKEEARELALSPEAVAGSAAVALMSELRDYLPPGELAEQASFAAAAAIVNGFEDTGGGR